MTESWVCWSAACRFFKVIMINTIYRSPSHQELTVSISSLSMVSIDHHWYDRPMFFRPRVDYDQLTVNYTYIDYNRKSVHYSRILINRVWICIGEKVKFMNLSALLPSKDSNLQQTSYLFNWFLFIQLVILKVYMASKVKHRFIIHDTLLKTIYFVIFLYQHVCLIHNTIQNAIWLYCSRSVVSCIHHTPI